MRNLDKFLDEGELDPKLAEDEEVEGEEEDPDPGAEIDPIIETLKKERLARGMTLEQVAERMGLKGSSSAVWRLESGSYDVRLSTLRNWHQAVYMEMISRSTKPGMGRRKTNFR